nr:MAG TPA: hypothetical protein [Caudoviricetes sp.]
MVNTLLKSCGNIFNTIELEFNKILFYSLAISLASFHAFFTKS